MNNIPLINSLWLLFCASLVLFQQVGFLCLESGATQSKNNINVAAKNLTDGCIAFILFWAIGYSISFSSLGSLTLDSALIFFSDNEMAPTKFSMFILQCLYCCTTATIVSGAVAERMSFKGYIVLTALVAALIYPATLSLIYANQAWLAFIGFHDFSGGTFVHSTAGWVSLAAVLLIGPRAGRFNDDGSVNEMPSSNLVLSAMGALILWFGWIGFNGGSQGEFNAQTPSIVFNTIISSCGGAVTVLLLNLTLKTTTNIMQCISAMLAGLVCVSAGADILNGWQALLFGMAGGLICLLTERILLSNQIDDTLGVVSIHLAPGVFGTLLISVVAPNIISFSSQVAGVICCGILAFGLTHVLMRLLTPVVNWRVSAEDELAGLNLSEHNAIDDLVNIVAEVSSRASNGDFSARVSSDRDQQNNEVTQGLNNLLDVLEGSQQKLKGEQAKTEHFEKNAEKLTQSISNHAAVTFTNLSGKIVYVNNEFSELCGYEIEELKHSSHRLLNSDTHGKAFWQELWGTITAGQDWQGSICNRNKSGKKYWVQATVTAQYSDSDDHRIIGYMSIQTPIKNKLTTAVQNINPAVDPLEQLTPLTTNLDRKPKEQASKNEVHQNLKDMPKLRCLLVEDNPDNQVLAEMLLEDIGMRFDIRENGEEAVQAVQENDYDLVLMDIQMPVMDGLTATREIRKLLDETTLPIVAMTASALPEDQARYEAAGMNGFIAKPIEFDDMQAVIARVTT